MLFGLRCGAAMRSNAATRSASAANMTSASNRATELADAQVDARPEPYVPLRPPCHVELVRLGPLARIAICGTPETAAPLRPLAPRHRSTSTARVVVRKKVCTGDSQRKTSSKAGLMSERSARTRSHCSGCVANARMALASPLTVVSRPAVSSERTRMGASSAVSSPASCAAQMSAANPTSAHAPRAHCACIHATTGSAARVEDWKISLRGPNELNTMVE